MKIIHTSDWHIGQNFYRYDRDDEHRHFFDQLAQLLGREQPDALVVSGDVFHNAAPSTAAQRLFVESVVALHDASPQTTIVITAGNHDSGNRLEADRLLWQRMGVHVIGGCMRSEDGTFDPAQFRIDIPGKGHILAVPYFHSCNYPAADVDTARDDRQRCFFETLLAQTADSPLPTVLMAHLAVDGCNTRGHEDEPVGGMLKEKITDLGQDYDYLALGHIHMPQRISDRAYYCGSPLPVSFSEDYNHFVNIVEISAHGATPTVQKEPLTILRRVKTIPEDGAPLEQALAAFSAHDSADNSYVRILVDQDDVLAADAEDRARKIAEDKACRFCEIRRKPRSYKGFDKEMDDIQEVEDFTRIEPLEIALRSYERTNQVPMSDTLVEMMKQAIKLATK